MKVEKTYCTICTFLKGMTLPEELHSLWKDAQEDPLEISHQNGSSPNLQGPNGRPFLFFAFPFIKGAHLFNWETLGNPTLELIHYSRVFYRHGRTT